jgi:L-alanine-DL-glutamate epimerase-like enolase superfamily enzyme
MRATERTVWLMVRLPEERFERGSIHVPERPGFGIQLNDKLAKSHPV